LTLNHLTKTMHLYCARKSDYLKKAKAYAPSHITGFFVIYRNGSTGAGINIEEGVTTEVIAEKNNKNKIEIKINGKKKKAKTSERVIKEFLKKTNKKFEVKVNHKTKMPQGYGLGTSGASALSLALALNKALGLRLAKKKCVEIAKKAEIKEGTGLGDVIAEQFHGLMLGKKPYPSQNVEIVHIKERHVVMAFFAPIDTKKVITSKRKKEKINKSGKKCMEEFSKRKSLGNFMKQCKHFSRDTGLLTKRLEKVIHKVPVAGMAMLGETLFIVTNNPARAKKILLRHCKKVQISRIAEKGAHLI